MSSEVLTVIYRPHEHAEEYLVFIDDEKEYKEWKAQPEGGKTIALSRFVGNFAIVSVRERLSKASRGRCPVGNPHPLSISLF